ncbi:F-box protein PP2-A13-like [Wolffia australiana]
MGAGASSLLGQDADPRCATGLGNLPEDCAALVLMNLDPPEICKLARLNRAFRGAASADFVWESKLPRNYPHLLEKIRGGEAGRTTARSKKEIYARLSKPNPFDGGAKVFWLHKHKGGVCLPVSAKALAITGIDDRRYWSHIPTEESRFQTVAYLQQTWWFEVDGEIEFWLPPGEYSLFFRLHLGRPGKSFGRRVWSSEHVHGWDVKPVQFQLETSAGQRAQRQCFLEEAGSWVHYEVGSFSVASWDKPTRVKFSMMQIDCTHTKGGLCVDSAVIYPRGVRPERVSADGRFGKTL